MRCQGFVAFVLLFIGVVTSMDTKEFQKNLHATIIWGIPGQDVDLPCDVSANSSVTMIFWFKDEIKVPLYSLDARGGPLSAASHLAMSDDLGARSFFISDDNPSTARLRIRNVHIHDQGLFRCRVDFLNSPTKNYQINLTLVEQPSSPKIFDAEGREIKVNESAGPFFEGHELFLSCQVSGGRPRPTLTWWHNGTILDSLVDSGRATSTTVNQLTVVSVPRYLKGTRLECRATSDEKAGHVVREVPITVFLKPNKVKIVTANGLLSTQKSQNIRCESSGSYPPAKLTWLLDGKPIRNAVVTEEVTETFTGSIVSLSVAAEDDGKELVCRADNPRFPGGTVEDARQIHVAYPPRVAVKMDSANGGPINEDTDIILRCETSARPQPLSYSWYQNGYLIPYNDTAGVLPIDHILTLKNIKQKSGGQYACSATNTEGETYSPPFELLVQFAPRCSKGYEIMRVGALPHKTLVVQCHVDSVPEVTRFSWTYNTTRGVFPVQGAKMQNTGNVSILHFTPGEEDLESLSCWATNDVGRQQTPCLFYIVPAAAPESPKNCMLRNASHGGLEVSCIAGKDGGLHQSFVLEVSDISIPTLPPGITTLSDQGEKSGPMYRVLGERPVFRLHSLESGRQYHVVVYAENAKGRSDPPVVLPNLRVEGTGGPGVPSEEPLQESESGGDKPEESGSGSSRRGLTLIIIGLTAAAVLLIVGIVVAAAVVACRKPPATVRRRPRNTRKPPDDGELSEAGFGEDFHRRSAQYRMSMYGEAEERISRLIEGPDLILAPVSFSPQSSDY